MTTSIIPIKTGFSHSFLIKGNNGAILVDTGVKNNINKFVQIFNAHHIKPNEINLIVLTHTHYDHTGNLAELKEWCGAKILVHKNEAENLKNGFTPIPSGTIPATKIIVALGRSLKPKYASPPAIVPDLINENEFDLNKYGINGKVIFTPGHTEGSQSVLIDKNLLAGDTFFNIRNKVSFPPFANNILQLLKTWETILKWEIKRIYPAHGPSFEVEKVLPLFQKWKKKHRK
jgi:glyoxylase-like metal-dependent hydrolase (beta-lactamase superfamily II)